MLSRGCWDLPTPISTMKVSRVVPHLREASELKNVTKSGKSPKGGGGVSSENQKVHNSKCGLCDKMGGGEARFSVFSQMYK